MLCIPIILKRFVESPEHRTGHSTNIFDSGNFGSPNHATILFLFNSYNLCFIRWFKLIFLLVYRA